jgi:type III secretion protein D
MTQDLELRILTGLHQGARCPAQDGVLLGSHEQCDVVLCDEGIASEAARLWIGNTAWRLTGHGDPQDAPTELPFGTPWSLGTIHVTVAHPDDAWPSSEELSALLRFPKESGAHAGDAVPGERLADETAASGKEGGKAEIATAPHGYRDALQKGSPPQENTLHSRVGSTQRKKSRLRWAAGGLLLLLVFGGAASYSPAGVQSDAHIPAAPLADNETLARTQQLLRRLGYADRLRASLSSDHQVVVTGWVRDNKDHDELATVLTGIWPLPSLRVDDQEQVSARIAAQSADLDMRVAVEYPGPGHLIIRGIAATDAVRTQALERLKPNDDAGPRVTMTVSLAGQVSAAVYKAVAAAGLPAVSADWKDKVLWIGARGFDTPQLKRLEGILEALNSSYMNALRLRPDELPASPGVPFRVHSVVGGAQPWVMLEDGTRIVVGGTHGAYSLKSIEDGRVVFDGPSTAVIAR